MLAPCAVKSDPEMAKTGGKIWCWGIQEDIEHLKKMGLEAETIMSMTDLQKQEGVQMALHKKIEQLSGMECYGKVPKGLNKPEFYKLFDTAGTADEMFTADERTLEYSYYDLVAICRIGQETTQHGTQT